MEITSLSVLIAGCGSIGRRHARVLRSIGMQDIRICDPDSDQRKALTSEGPVSRKYADFESALRDEPDTVLICTPPELHIPMAIQALNSGAHVLSEKPLSDSLAGVEELEAAIKRSGKVFSVAFCFRHHEGLTLARKHLQEGRIGRLVSLRLCMGEHLPEVRPDYKKLFTLKRGGAFDLTHEIDLACWFADQPFTEVRSLQGACSDLGFSAPDLVELIIGFSDRCIASVHLDLFSLPRRRVTELLGTTGSITVEFASWDRCTVSVYEQKNGEWKREELATERDEMFRREDREFLQAVVSDTPVSCPLSEAVKSQKIISLAGG
jgi:predicted dehydrogenase